ncbi:MAG: hypothetical protein GY940_42310 [bacterium]|nr:hypothetical protein [bacterium]
MSLKKRLLFILIASGFILAVFFHFSINTTMVPDLEEQKRLMIRRLEKKLKGSLDLEKRNIAALCNNWADREGLLEDIKNRPVILEGHMLNVIMVIGPDGRVVFDKTDYSGIDTGPNPPRPLGIEKAAAKLDKDVKPGTPQITGLVNSNYGPLLVTAHRLKGNEEKDEEKALLILGRFPDRLRTAEHQHELEPATKDDEKIRWVSFMEKELFKSCLNRVRDGDFVYREDQEQLNTLYLVRDIFGVPSLVLSAQTPYKLFWVAKRHTILYIAFSVFSMLLMGVLVYLLVGKYINRRIISISANMKNVQGLKDIDLRIRDDVYGDEISTLIANINHMLDKLETEKRNREEMEQQLITNEKLVSIGRLSASIAHEINNPILAISNCFQALKRTCQPGDDDDRETCRQALRVSETEISRIRDIISSLLDYHRMDKEGFSPVDLEEVLGQSLEVLKWSKKLAHMKIITEEKKRDRFMVYGSAGKIKQVFMNFILNAAEAVAGKDQGKRNSGILSIRVQPSPDPGNCEIHFTDNGPGIPEELSKRVFEPFVSSKPEKGVGLGLYVSYKIIENHGGSIRCDENQRQGAHFIVTLPLETKQ